MHDNDRMPADDELRTHILVRMSATLGIHTWSRLQRAIQRLLDHFRPLEWSAEMDGDKLIITRWDAAPNADRQIVIERCVSPSRWKPNRFGHQQQRLRLDGRRSSAFVECVLMLLRLHYTEHLTVASTVGYADWQIAMMHLMEGVCDGPWVDRQVVRDPATRRRT